MRYLLLATVLVGVLICSSATLAVDVDIADETIAIPAPAGFVEISALSKEQYTHFEDMCPPASRLLAVFVSQNDAARILQGDTADFSRYMVVYTIESLQEVNLTKGQFKELRTALRREYNSLFQDQRDAIDKAVGQASQALSKRLDTDLTIKVDGVVPLGIDSETASSITMTQLARYAVSMAGEDSGYVVASTMVMLLAKGKVLYLNVFRTYENEADLTWTRDTARDWRARTLSANRTTWQSSASAIVPQGTPIDSVTKRLLSGEWSEYRLAPHPKALGLDISLKYPKSWRAAEGIRPHIVQKFTGDTVGGIGPSCMVFVEELPTDLARELDGVGAEDLWQGMLQDGLQDMIPPGSTLIDGGMTKIDGEPSVWLKYHLPGERAGMRVHMYMLQYMLVWDGKMVAITGAVGGAPEDRELVEDAFASYLPVFQEIGNNVVLHDKWATTRDASSELVGKVRGEPWWKVLILWSGLTFGIGLALPLLIRVLFLRKPLSRRASIVPVIVFVLLAGVSVAVLEIEVATLSAVAIVAVASYVILHKGYVERETEEFAVLEQPPKRQRAVCPNCGSLVSAPDSLRVSRAQCSSCGAILTFRPANTTSQDAGDSTKQVVPPEQGAGSNRLALWLMLILGLVLHVLCSQEGVFIHWNWDYPAAVIASMIGYAIPGILMSIVFIYPILHWLRPEKSDALTLKYIALSLYIGFAVRILFGFVIDT